MPRGRKCLRIQNRTEYSGCGHSDWVRMMMDVRRVCRGNGAVYECFKSRGLPGEQTGSCAAPRYPMVSGRT